MYSYQYICILRGLGLFMCVFLRHLFKLTWKHTGRTQTNIKVDIFCIPLLHKSLIEHTEEQQLPIL
jgi:hypothetical protein